MIPRGAGFALFVLALVVCLYIFGKHTLTRGESLADADEELVYRAPVAKVKPGKPGPEQQNVKEEDEEEEDDEDLENAIPAVKDKDTSATSGSFFSDLAQKFKQEQKRANKDLVDLLDHFSKKSPPSTELISSIYSRNYIHVKCMCYTGLGNRLPGLVAGFGFALADSYLTGKPRAAVVEYPIGGCRGAKRWWDNEGIDWDFPRRGKCTEKDEKDGEGWTELDSSGIVSDDEFERLAREEEVPPTPETLGQLILLLDNGRLDVLLHSLFPEAHKKLAAGKTTNSTARSTNSTKDCPWPVPKNMQRWIFHDDDHLPSHISPLLKSNLSHCHPNRLWRLWTGDYLLPLLEANPNYASFFHRAFPNGDAFYQLARAFWRPAERLQKGAEAFAKEKLGKVTVSVHVRTIKSGGTVPPLKTYLDAVLSTARNLGALPKGLLPGGGGGKGVEESENEPLQFRLFLATDSPNVTLPKYLEPFTLRFTPPESLKTMNAQENPSTDDEGVTDMILLGLADAVITTFGSSFGNVASSLAGKVPYVVLHQGVGGMLTVIRATTSEPCMFHSSVLLRWAGLGKEDVADIEYPPWYEGKDEDKKKEEGWAKEAGRAWEAYSGHRGVGECHW